MSEKIPQHVLETVQAQLLGDPQLPRPNPTTSFWQIPTHPDLADIQSTTLPQQVDYAIIGSGITGCSIANTLLELCPSASITIFEARTLCSGATGRNGGLLTTFVPSEFATISDEVGLVQATKIARFANRTLKKMHELCNSSQEFKEASEVRRLRDVVCFRDKKSFEAAKISIQLYEEHVPEEKGTFEFWNPEEAREKYNVRETAGVITFNCGAFWPYRLITKLYAQLHSQYAGRFSIETKTPVTAIALDQSSVGAKSSHVVTTPRGSVRACNIIYATNGYTGHLLPKLRGTIFPLRGTMSTQKGSAEFGNFGNERAWSFCDNTKFDSETCILETGLYYSNQNPKSGDIFIGGEKAKLDEVIVADDTNVSVASEKNISTILPKLFINGWSENESPEIRKVWSGIMGFTSDHMPLVGPLPANITGRGAGEWIAAGFNGYGMPQCWSAGEAVAKMCLGKDVSDFLPEVFLTSGERLSDEKRLDTEGTLGRLLGI